MPANPGWHQHDDDPWGVLRWFDGARWQDRTTGHERDGDPRVTAPEEVLDPSSPRFLARAYGAACGTVVNASDLCLQSAETALGLRDLSVRERTFVPPYKQFLHHCEAARTAARLLLAAPADDHELLLFTEVTARVYGQVIVAKHILDGSFGSTPQRFVDELNRVNEEIEADIFFLGEPGFIPHIHRPPVPTHRTCPWCAEPIRIAAKVCRYCTRDVDPV